MTIVLPGLAFLNTDLHRGMVAGLPERGGVPVYVRQHRRGFIVSTRSYDWGTGKQDCAGAFNKAVPPEVLADCVRQCMRDLSTRRYRRAA